MIAYLETIQYYKNELKLRKEEYFNNIKDVRNFLYENLCINKSIDGVNIQKENDTYVIKSGKEIIYHTIKYSNKNNINNTLSLTKKQEKDLELCV